MEYDEERDKERELRADGENPFPICRKVVADVVGDKLGVRVERVVFLSSGTFHKVRTLPSLSAHNSQYACRLSYYI